MAQTKIAEVRLVAGQGNYFDELTRIHLTIGNPIGEIYSGMNLTNIRRAVKAGRLFLLRGSLGPDPTPYKLVAENGKYKLSIQKPKNKIENVSEKIVEPKSEMKNIEAVKTESEKNIEIPEKNISEVQSDIKTTSEIMQDFLGETDKAVEENNSKSEKKKKRNKKDNAEAES